jgi:hypothetical protein
MTVENYRLCVTIGRLPGMTAHIEGVAYPRPGSAQQMIRQPHQGGYSCEPSLEGIDWRMPVRVRRPELAG